LTAVDFSGINDGLAFTAYGSGPPRSFFPGEPVSGARVVTARAERARRLTRTGFPAGAGSRVPGAARDVTGASGGAPDAATM